MKFIDKLMKMLLATIFVLLGIFTWNMIEEMLLQLQLEAEQNAKRAANKRGSKVFSGPGVIIIYEVKRRW